MIPLWLLLLFLAQFAWAFENFLDKYLLEKLDNDNGVGVLVLVSSSLISMVTITTLFISFFVTGGNPWPSNLLIPPGHIMLAIVTGIIGILWLIPYMYAMDRSDETLVVPLFQTVPIFGFLLGLSIFGEIPTGQHIIAGIVILVGALVLNMEIISEENTPSKRIAIDWQTILLMLLSSCLFATASFVFKEATPENNFLATIFWASIGSLLAGFCIWLCVPSYRRELNGFFAKKNTYLILVNILNEVIDNIATYVFFIATVLAPTVAIAQSSIAYQPIFLLIIAAIAARLGSVRHRLSLSGYQLFRRVLGIFIIVIGSIYLLY